jgi:hypothetical protein
MQIIMERVLFEMPAETHEVLRVKCPSLSSDFSEIVSGLRF